eukprot:6646302-Pyramimonas_sp.AAC.1
MRPRSQKAWSASPCARACGIKSSDSVYASFSALLSHNHIRCIMSSGAVRHRGHTTSPVYLLSSFFLRCRGQQPPTAHASMTSAKR